MLKVTLRYKCIQLDEMCSQSIIALYALFAQNQDKGRSNKIPWTSSHDSDTWQTTKQKNETTDKSDGKQELYQVIRNESKLSIYYISCMIPFVDIDDMWAYIAIIPVNLWELLGGRSPPYQLF